jgi:hypothetical protein
MNKDKISKESKSVKTARGKGINSTDLLGVNSPSNYWAHHRCFEVVASLGHHKIFHNLHIRIANQFFSLLMVTLFFQDLINRRYRNNARFL